MRITNCISLILKVNIMNTIFNSYNGNNIIPLYQELPVRIKSNKKLFCEFIYDYTSKKYVTKPSRVGYNAIAKHIEKYCDKYDIDHPYTDSIDAEWVEEFVYYLKSDCNLMLTTIVGMLEKLRALLNKATLYGHSIDNSFREIKLKSEETNAVYLPDDEILKIYFYKELNKKEEVVRDYFIIASGGSNTQVKSLAEELEQKMDEVGVHPKRVEGEKTAVWVLMDYGDVLVHIFHGDTQIGRASCRERV